MLDRFYFMNLPTGPGYVHHHQNLSKTEKILLKKLHWICTQTSSKKTIKIRLQKRSPRDLYPTCQKKGNFFEHPPPSLDSYHSVGTAKLDMSKHNLNKQFPPGIRTRQTYHKRNAIKGEIIGFFLEICWKVHEGLPKTNRVGEPPP